MIKRFFRDQINKRKNASEVFSQVYAQKKWGDEGYPFFSGPGSYDEFSVPYVQVLQDHINSNYSAMPTFVDLGCGDFRVGEKIIAALPGLNYHGVDVVADMVAHHTREYASERIEFSCRDIAEDELPTGEVATIRQVLQHLSNAQIAKICAKLDQYQAVFITEHYPSQLNTPNVDIVHGRRSRRKHNSAVVLDQAPFSLGNLQEVLRVPHRKSGEYLVTHLYRPKQVTVNRPYLS